jgi:Spy/CpxP family protein refolding chaperone
MCMSGILALVLAAAVGVTGARADEEKGHGKGYGGGAYGGHGGSGMMHGMMGKSGHHGTTGHFLRHLQKHSKEIGLSDEQVNKIKTLQLDLDRTRIRMEAEIQVAERELDALIHDEKAEMSAIEAKVKQSEALEADLRIVAVKTKREAWALLTPDQRAKEKAEHEKMMSHMGGMMGHEAMKDNPHGGGAKKDEKKSPH